MQRSKLFRGAFSRRSSRAVAFWSLPIALLVCGLFVSATRGFDDGEPEGQAETPAQVGLRGIFPSEVPANLNQEAFSALDGNWKEWSTEVAGLVAKLYEDESLDVAGQRELLGTLQSKLDVMDRALDDDRYRSIYDELAALHGPLSRRVALGEAILDTLELDPEEQQTARVESAERDVVQTVRDLEDYLRSIPNGTAWLPWVRAEELTGSLSGDGPSDAAVPVARSVREKIAARDKLNESQREFLSRRAFTRLERSLNEYVETATTPVKAADRDEFRSVLADLVAALEDYETSAGTGAAARARDVFNRVRDLALDGGQRLSGVLRKHYFNYNFRVAASENLLERFVAQTRTESGPVRDYILGADVYGNQVTDTRVGLDLQPSNSDARFDITLNGNVRSSTSGYTERATVYTSGNHYFWAAKEIRFDGDRFTTRRARISVDANNTTTGADTEASGTLFEGLAENIAVDRAQEKRPESEAIAAQRVRSQVLPKFNQEVDKDFAKASRDIQKLDRKLKDKGLYPSAERLRTSDSHLYYRARLMRSGELGGGTPRTQVAPGTGLAVHVHQSLMNNSVDKMDLAGKTLTEEELGKEFERAFSELLGREIKFDQPQEQDSSKPATFVFDKSDPIRFRVGNGQVTLVIRTGLKQEDGDEIPMQEITVPINMKLEGNQIVLTRGSIKVQAVEKPESIAKQVAQSGVIRKKIQLQLPERKIDGTVTIEPDEEGQGGQPAVELTVAEIKAIDGWLTIAFR